MAEPRECKRCHKVKIIKSRGLCGGCYSYTRKYGNIEDYKKDNIRLKVKYDNCIDCGKYCHIQGKQRCRKCYQKWYLSFPENKKRHAEQEKQRRLDNPTRYREIEQKRQQTDKRRKWRDGYNQEYYKLNEGRLRQYQVEWRQNNKEQFSGYMREARQRRINAEGFTTEEQWRKIVQFYCPDNKCLKCGQEFVRSIQNRKITQDHVIPISRGGTHWPDNIQPLCYACNCSKSDHNADDFRPDKGEFARSLMYDKSPNDSSLVRTG